MDALVVARRFDPAWATVLETLYLGYPLRSVSSQEALRAREILAGWEADQVGLSTNFVLFAHNGFHRSLRLYLLALTSIWAGDPEAAISYASELPRVHSDRDHAAIAAGWGQSIRARVSAAAGRTEEAIRQMEDVELNAPLERIAISPFFSRAYDRYTLGQLHTSVGRIEEALDWYRSLTEGYEVVFVAPAHLQMGRILDEAGEPEQAAEHYRRFLELWQNPDPGFQPLLEEARERLSVLDPSPTGSGSPPR
jgi:tetratricopeptide (TPR) repeat protein